MKEYKKSDIIRFAKSEKEGQYGKTYFKRIGQNSRKLCR